MPTDSQYLVYSSPDSMRLDRFVQTLYPELSRAYIQGLIEQGVICLNGKPGDKGSSLKQGDKLELKPFLLPSDRKIKPNPNLPLEIVDEEKDFLVFNKPAGIPTHPNEFEDNGTVANFLVAKYPDIFNVGEDPLRPGIVHRLDTDTSGLLLAAKTSYGFTRLRNLFDAREIKKTYLALVLGKITQEGNVSFPVAHHPNNPRRMIAIKTGKEEYRSRLREAQTLYKPIQLFSGATLLEVRTLTGRMHQVRVHLSAIGHPLVGDKLYQEKKQHVQDTFNLGRHFLHASRIVVPFTADQPAKEYTSPLAPDLQNLVNSFTR